MSILFKRRRESAESLESLESATEYFKKYW